MITLAAPPGCTVRALTLADLDAAYALYAAAEAVDAGEANIEREDLESDWQRPHFDLTRHSVGIFDGDGLLIAAAERSWARRGEAAVHPERRGEGLGTWLANWLRARATEAGDGRIGTTVPQGSAGETLLRDLGYRPLWTSWVLEVPEGAEIAAQPLPAGYRLRTYVGEEDAHAAYRLIEDAFNEWPERDPRAFDDWRLDVVGRTGFDPWQVRLVETDAGEPVGVALSILDSQGSLYVAQLAVRADQRRRGLARALLADAFARGREHGARRSELSTDSRTGALDVYLSVGMVVTKTWVHLSTPL